ncbi:response regulator [Azotobacter salinestris]|uniref:response regulator n=1 Tax=Azotobacter salinestris TaxID=69964 RepID=UPI001266D54B|nr:response regulator transcription factor [Azotobacter salinestris]
MSQRNTTVSVGRGTAPRQGDPVRILLVDDHTLFREALAILLARETDLDVVGQAANGEQALALVRQLAPDIMLLDLEMPVLNGLDTLARLPRAGSPRVLCVSAHSEQRRIQAALAAGAAGYIIKDCARDELSKAIRIVASGGAYLSQDLATSLIFQQRELSAGSCRAPAELLSLRERQILQLMVEGLSSRQIAEGLHISIKTVNTHREHIMAKLKVKGIAQLTRYVLREGLF